LKGFKNSANQFHNYTRRTKQNADRDLRAAAFPIPAADPVSAVRFLMERQKLTQRDLIPQFGSESAVSMFMTGRRNLTLEQVRRLSARFGLT
jgi:antitoxin component HigA of HigAB toxin-antitoxin module